MIAKNHRHQGPVLLHQVRLIKFGRPQVPLSLFDLIQGPLQDRFVGCQPLDPLPGDQRNDLLRDRPFRRPHPLRPAAKPLFVKLDRHFDLSGSISRMLESGFRQLDTRQRFPGDIGIAEERQDRVIERGRGQLDLPPLAQLPVLGNDLAHHFELLGDDRAFVFRGKVFPLGDQTLDHRVLVPVDKTEPGQVEPDLQVKQFLVRKPGRHSGQLGRRDKSSALQQ